jgi:signal transduction histidine kinase
LWLGLIVGAVAVAAATAIARGLKEIAPPVSLSVVYVPVVLLLSAYWGLGLGLLASIASALAFDFFELPPVGSFDLSDGRDWVALGVFMIVAAAASALASVARSRGIEAERRRRQEVIARARVVTAADEERRRVVRNLHDGAQERLVHAVVGLKLALRAMDQDDPDVRELLEAALREAEEANAELHELAHGILPSALTRRGLRAGIAGVASRMTVPVTVDVPDQRFPPVVEATAYVVLSEALANVVKHAQASRASVSAYARDGHLYVEVSDDGVGGAARIESGGLAGLEDRVSALDGSLVVHSPRGHGTRVRACLPLPKRS